MKPSEAIKIIKRLISTVELGYKAAGPLTDKGEYPETKALNLAISALEKQEEDRWRPFERREPTEEEGNEFDYIMDCELPEDGQAILVTVNCAGHEQVQADIYFGGGGEECYLDSGYSLVDEAIAWKPFPKPYQEEK